MVNRTILASLIQDHMEVRGSDNKHVGTVDHMEGPDRIKLSKSDSPDGKHHYIGVDWVDHVDSQVHLNRTSFQTMKAWRSAP